MEKSLRNNKQVGVDCIDAVQLKAFGDLLGAMAISAHPLNESVWQINLADGRAAAVKGVPRQSTDRWRPGQPWTELVALDALSDAGAPVPRLLAADLHNGWLAVRFIKGRTLAQCMLAPDRFIEILHGLDHLQRVTEEHWTSLRPFAPSQPSDSQSIFASVKHMLEAPAAQAWDHLVRAANLDEEKVPGPLDVHAGNVIYCTERRTFVFLDMAVLGEEHTERRLVAYCSRVRPTPATMIGPTAFEQYDEVRGSPATARLLCYDLAYWAIALARSTLADAGGLTGGDGAPPTDADPGGDTLRRHVYKQWMRPRLDSPLERQIKAGLKARFQLEWQDLGDL